MFRTGMLVAAALIGCGGCGGGKTASMVGTWEATIPEMKGMSIVFTFTADGKYTQETVLEGVPKADNVTIDGGKQEGTYKLEDKAMTLTTKGVDKKVTVKEHTDSKLVIVNAEGKELSLTKK